MWLHLVILELVSTHCTHSLEVVDTIVEMEVSTSESSVEKEHNRIYPGASIEERSSSEVDEISEEAEYRNIHGEDGTPEYENEARIEDGEDDRLGSKTDVSTGSPNNRHYTVLDASTRERIRLHLPFTIEEQAIQPQLNQTICHVC